MDGTAKSDQTIIGGIVRATLALCMVLTVPAVATSQPKFSDSTITTVPRVVAEGDVVTFHVAVRNTGNEDAPFTEMTLGLPLEPLFVDLSGLDNAKVDRAAKSVTAVFDLSVGETDEFAVRMVVPRDAGGNTLVPDLALRFPHRGVEFRGGEPIMIETAVSGRGLSIGGGVRIAPAGLAVVAVLVLYPALWMTLPRRRRRHSAIFMIVLATAFLTMFAGLAYRDWQTLGVWLETSCTILDKRMRVDTQASSIRSRAGGRRAEVLSLQQLLALKYAAHGGETISTGYETGTRLTIGRGERLAEEYARWTIGDVPCWFNPADTRDVIVIRGFGGAYLFAAIPLAFFALGVLNLTRRRWR